MIIILLLIFFILKEGCLDAEEALLEKMTVIQKQSEHACRKPRCTRSKEKYLPEEITWSTGKNNGHPLVLGFWAPKQKTEKYFGTCWQRPLILILDSVTGTLQLQVVFDGKHKGVRWWFFLVDRTCAEVTYTSYSIFFFVETVFCFWPWKLQPYNTHTKLVC